MEIFSNATSILLLLLFLIFYCQAMQTLKNMPPDFVRTFSRHLKIYEFLGLHIIYDAQRGKYNENFRFICYIVFCIVMTLSQLMFVCLGQNKGADMLDIFLALPCGMVFLLDLIKMYVMAAKKVQITELLTEMGDLWPRELFENGMKNYEMRSRTQRARTFDNILLYGIAVALFVFHTVPIALTFKNFFNLEPTYLTSHLMYFPWDINSLGRYVVCDSLIVSFGCSIYIGIGLNTELFLVALLNDLSVLFRLLHIDLENVIPFYEDKDMNVDERNEQTVESLINIIRTHQKLLRLSERINKIFGIIIFTTTSTSAVLICFFGFLTVVSKGTYIFMYVMGLFGMVTSILNFSWPGQLLYDASSGVAYAAYDCLWYKREPKIRKLILIIIYRSQKSCYLTALGISNMSYETLVTVFNTSLSYMSLLRQLYAEEQLI